MLIEAFLNFQLESLVKEQQKEMQKKDIQLQSLALSQHQRGGGGNVGDSNGGPELLPSVPEPKVDPTDVAYFSPSGYKLIDIELMGRSLMEAQKCQCISKICIFVKRFQRQT